MSTNYRESTTTIVHWRRASEVHLYNPLEGERCVYFTEDDMASRDGRTWREGAGPGVREAFAADGEFPLIDPATGEVFGRATHAQVYLMLFSLYRHLAQQRDQQQEPT